MELVELQKIHEKVAPKGVVVLGFDYADGVGIAQEFLRKNAITFPNIIDPSEASFATAWEKYRTSGVPVNYIIDREGKIVDGWYGYEKGDKRGLETLKKLGVR